MDGVAPKTAANLRNCPHTGVAQQYVLILLDMSLWFGLMRYSPCIQLLDNLNDL